MSKKQSKDLFPIACLLNGLTDEDVNCRINSMRSLTEIAGALGHQRSRNELVPFITDTCTDDEEEVLNEFAEQMGNFSKYVGGIKHIDVILKPLEILCKVEEPSVRENAVKSINKIIGETKSEKQPGLATEHVFPLVKKLGSDNWYTSRSSACGILNHLYPLLSEKDRKVIRELYAKLCKDETPMVRRYCAKNLSDLARVYEKEYLICKDENRVTLFKLFEGLRIDDQDSVRLLAIDNAISLCGILEDKQKEDLIIPIIKSLGKDTSWRVKYMVADRFSDFCIAVGKELTRKELVSLFTNFFVEKEAEVRTAAAFQIAGVCSLLTKEQVISSILPTIKKIVKDKSEHVRSALASVIMSISSLLGKDSTIKNLLEHFLALLKDEFSEVRLNIISKLSDVNSVIGAELLSGSGLMPSICELATDKQWRVRLSIIKYIPLLAKQLGKDYFNDKLRKMCVTWLQDSVYTIRVAATNNIIELTRIFGEDWAKDHLIKEALNLRDMSNYLYRMIVLFLISGLSAIVTNDLIGQLLPNVLKLADDQVPNIRFNVAKTLTDILSKLDQKKINQVKPVLEKLEKDSDVDVREYAKKGLKKLKEM